MQDKTLHTSDQPKSERDIPFVPSYKLSGRMFFLILATQVLALCLLRYELFTTFSSHIIGGFSGDGGLYYWLTHHNSTSLLALPWFNTRAFYPYTETLAWSDNFILPSLVFNAVQSLNISSVAAYNSVLTLAMLLSGVSMAHFCFLITGNIIAANFAGALFMGNSYMSSVLGHPQLQFTFFFPMAAYQLFIFFKQRSLKASVLIGILITTAFLTTVYYAIFLALFITIVSLTIYLLRPSQFLLADLRTLLVGLAFGSLPLLFFAAPYLDIREVFGARFLYEPYFFSASLPSLFSASHASLLFSWTKDWGHEEAHFFIGLLPFLLLTPLLLRLGQARPLRRLGLFTLGSFLMVATLSIFSRSRIAELTATIGSYIYLVLCPLFLIRLGQLERTLGASYLTFRSLSALFLTLFLTVFIIALGPLGNSASGELCLAPYRIFYELFPGFNSIRAISRVMIIGLFALSVLSALSIKLLIQRFKVRPVWCLLIVAFFILENISYPLAKEPVPERPLVFEMVKNHRQVNDSAILLPFSGSLKESGEFQSWKDFAKIQVSAMNWSQDIQISLVNGYSGQQTKLMKELPRELAQFPDQRSLRALRSIAGLRFIIFAPQFSEGFSQENFDIRIRFHRDDLKLLQVDQQGNYLFELTGEMTLDPDFQLLVPSFPPRSLSLQIGGHGEGDILDVSLLNSPAPTLLASIKIESDRSLRWYSLNLPLQTDTVRPLRLSFRSRSGQKLVLGQVRVKIDD